MFFFYFSFICNYQYHMKIFILLARADFVLVQKAITIICFFCCIIMVKFSLRDLSYGKIGRDLKNLHMLRWSYVRCTWKYLPSLVAVVNSLLLRCTSKIQLDRQDLFVLLCQLTLILVIYFGCPSLV